MRHGKAEPKKPGLSDFDRELTDEGRKDVEAVAKLIPVLPEVIYTSPLKRAVQTASIVSKVMGGVGVREAWLLEPEEASLSGLRDLSAGVGSTLFVGHAPSVNELASALIGGGRIKMPAGSAVGIEASEIDLGGGTLKFFVTPEVARKAWKII